MPEVPVLSSGMSLALVCAGILVWHWLRPRKQSSKRVPKAQGQEAQSVEELIVSSLLADEANATIMPDQVNVLRMSATSTAVHNDPSVQTTTPSPQQAEVISQSAGDFCSTSSAETSLAQDADEPN